MHIPEHYVHINTTAHMFHKSIKPVNRSNETITKVAVGLAHGRGITLSTQLKLAHVFPECIPLLVCKHPEKLSVEYILKYLTNKLI